MYFPYFRGRQYELLALRELVQRKILSESVIPVIEPVKFSTTFGATLRAFNDSDHKIALLLNPQVGDLKNNEVPTAILPYIIGSVTPAIIMNKDARAIKQAITESGKSTDDLLVVLSNQDYAEDYKKLFEGGMPKYTLFPNERRLNRTVQTGKVMFEDKFTKCNKNADYLKQEDEFFSDDHLYYEQEGFVGFGDYSIIGDNYDESGFAPWAVAIHMVYFDKENALRVHHFVSDSNYSIEDVAGKFYEAVTKLKQWFGHYSTKQQTKALLTFNDYADKGYYPGLPTIKKLSIMHHMELISKYLDGVVD